MSKLLQLVAAVTKLKLVQPNVKTSHWMFVLPVTRSIQENRKWLIPVVVLINSVNVLRHVHLRSKLLLLKVLKKVLSGAFFITSILLHPTLSQAFSQKFIPATKQQSVQPLPTLPSICPSLSEFPDSKIHSSQVKWIPDGDTIHTTDGHKIRLLHINTPEIRKKHRKAGKNHKKPNSSNQYYAQTAQKYLQQLVGKSGRIYWVSDIRRKDKYGRELAFIFNQQGSLINAKLIQAGLAERLIILPNQKYWQCIVRLERQARKAQRMLWSTGNNRPLPTNKVKANQGFQRVTGKITAIKNTRHNQWLILDNQLWLGIPNKNKKSFKNRPLNFKVNETIIVKGYVYYSHKKRRMKLYHPSMLIQHRPANGH